MRTFDRIELNAALDKLIESKGFSQEARHTIYQFGLSLAPTSRVSGSVLLQTPGDSFSAHTQEQGDVYIREDKDDVRKLDFGGQAARIGSYKVRREHERGGKFGIAIAHFWKLDEGTESETEEVQAWRLTCNENGPIWFGERATQTVWDHFGFSLKRRFVVETWGDQRGKRHHAGWQLELTV